MLKGRDKRGRWVKGVCGRVSGAGQRKQKTSNVPTSRTIRDAFYRTFVEIFVKDGSIKELVAFCKKNPTNMKLLLTEIRKLLPEIVAERDSVADGPVFRMPRPREGRIEPLPLPPQSKPAEIEVKESPVAVAVESKPAEGEEPKEEAKPEKKKDEPQQPLTSRQRSNVLGGRRGWCKDVLLISDDN